MHRDRINGSENMGDYIYKYTKQDEPKVLRKGLLERLLFDQKGAYYYSAPTLIDFFKVVELADALLGNFKFMRELGIEPNTQMKRDVISCLNDLSKVMDQYELAMYRAADRSSRAMSDEDHKILKNCRAFRDRHDGVLAELVCEVIMEETDDTTER